MNTREATKEEKDTLVTYLAYFDGTPDDEARVLVDGAHAVVFDYISQGPGYHGRLMLVVFAEPQYHGLYKLDGDSAIELVEKEGGE